MNPFLKWAGGKRWLIPQLLDQLPGFNNYYEPFVGSGVLFFALEPSRAIAPAFRNMLIRLKDGQELTGVRVGESESVLTVGDAQGQTHPLKKDQIEEVRTLDLSIMPEGLESGLTDTEFVDLIAFLAEQK